MPEKLSGAGTPEKESASEDSFFVDPNKSFLDEEEKPTGEQEAEVQGEEEEPEATEEPIKKGLTPEEQSWKDKFYSMQGKMEALQETWQETLAATRKPEVPVDTDDLEALAVAQWGEDPAILAMARKLKALESRYAETEKQEVSAITQKVSQTLEEFAHTRKEILSNPDIGNKFIEEIDDRLGTELNFTQLVKLVQSGHKFKPQFAETLKGKLERAYAAATAKTKDVAREEKSKQKVKARAEEPVGATPSPAIGDEEAESYSAALRKARRY